MGQLLHVSAFGSAALLHFSRHWFPWFGTVGYLLLVSTPGAWVAFGLSLDEISFWTRLCIAIVLSPLVVSVEFFAVRLLGIPFGTTAVLLVVLNLPAIYLVWKRRVQIPIPVRGDWLTGAAAVLVPVACMAPLLTNMNARVYSGHSWVHADAIYMFARGDLALEDPTLAGLRMSYPVWDGLVLQGIHSFLLNCPPVSIYVWTNLVWLIAVYGFAISIANEMGGSTLAQVCCGIMLLLGTNPVGYLLMKLAPLHTYRQFWGDPRYTPWVVKFLLFGPMALGLGMTMAIIYLLVRSVPLSNHILLVVLLLLSGIGLLYPLLFPPACGIVGARALSILADKQNRTSASLRKEWMALASVLFIACLLTYAEVRFLTADRRIATSEVSLSPLLGAARKIFASLIATCLLLVGLAFTGRNCLKSKRTSTVVLLLGALTGYALYALFHIPFYENEYKFVFAVSMCLAVFPALAVERVWRECTRATATGTLVLLGVLLFGTYSYWTIVGWPGRRYYLNYTLKFDPPLNTHDFYIQLDQRDPWSTICIATRRMTPADSVLLVNNDAIYFPGFTTRSLYVSPKNRDYAGVNLWADGIDGDLRGYGTEILEQRRATVQQFFDAKDRSHTEQALNEILALKRPVAVIVEPRHSQLLEWLKHRKTASELYAKDGLSLWLIDEASGIRR